MMNRRRDERGAVAVLTAALLTALVVMAAFVVDIGMQRVARRDMQALADVVALDLSRELDESQREAQAEAGLTTVRQGSGVADQVARARRESPHRGRLHLGLAKIVARIPVGRLGYASDIARGVAFLTSDDADFITGTTLSINGGQHMY